MDEIEKVSDPQIVRANLNTYLGKDVPLFLSSRKNKKYMVFDKNKFQVHFGDIRYEDFTKHQDKDRQRNYLTRATRIKGDWKKNQFSPNMLSINLLWK